VELHTAVAAHAAAVDASADASAALAAAEERAEAAGDRDALVRADAAHKELTTVAAELDAAVAKETRLAAEVERAGSVVERARANAADAHQALEAARTAHRAHALIGDLVAGEPCPVCTHVVETVPKRRRPAALGRTEAAVTEADTIVAQADGAYARLVKMHASADASAAQFGQRHDALATALAEQPDDKAVVATLKAVDKAQQQLAKARAAEKKARASADASAREVAAIEERTAALRAEYAARRDELLRHGCELPPPGDDLAPAWRELAAWAQAESVVREKAATTAREKRDALMEACATRLASFVDRAQAVEVATVAQTLGDVRDDVIRNGQSARHELHRIEESIERAEKLRAEVAAARAEHDVARLLGELLKSDRFEKWVLAEALAVLVDAASRTLHTLTQGNYSLRYSDDEEFVVVDHRNADETRSVRTLSGGETFQASLALALALSDQLVELSAAGGTKLDAIFCDEGFGSLDADTLDAVATTIESLASSGRVVGVVTHVPALAERVPVRFCVHNGTVTREET
jgi:exonuclease SbcC